MSMTIMHPGGIFTREQQEQLRAMEQQIIAALVSARAAGVPQGLIVAVVSGHAQIEITRLLDGAPS